jgi:hypothetical protein
MHLSPWMLENSSKLPLPFRMEVERLLVLRDLSMQVSDLWLMIRPLDVQTEYNYVDYQ